jgi:ribonuclease M5
MEKFPGVIVVEGKTDKDLIESFMNADIVMTGGSAVSRGTINYLKEVAKIRTVIVLTDPDSPGKRIRDILDENIPNLQHAYIRKEDAIKHHKVGVAESSPAVIKEALSHLVPSKFVGPGSLTPSDLYDLGLIGQSDSSKKRDRLEMELHLGHTNAKSLLQRCNSLNLTKEQLEAVVHGK